jgi:MinD superfamily P-loop ATPase/wyosine [tRNA(Phe)-imidazoG37] synthetase (radical SAM superfamily)
VKESGFKHLYGPVPSRRLGRSLGIDLVPFKTCTYDCVYCQLGRTTKKTLKRKEYVPVPEILLELKQKLAAGDTPDYISLAGSGEPTLNSGIGDLIKKIKSMTKIPVAVLTNGSLLWMREVQDALDAADLVLPSLDAGTAALFRHVNRPHRGLWFAQMVDGIAGFTKRFQGEVWLEVLLLAGVTGIPAEAQKIAAMVKRIGPARTQINTVTRPPAESYVCPVPSDQLVKLKDLFPGRVEIISASERPETFHLLIDETSAENVLALLRRRPCTSEDVAKGLGIHALAALKHLDALIREGQVTITRIDGRTFYAVIGAKTGIVIISGKGGTGKTSMAASFAVLAGRHSAAVIADCDVDAADLHLLLKPEIIRREKFVGGKKARIKTGHCIACGKCEEICNFNAVSFDGHGNGRVDRTFRIDPFACEGCGCCVRFCAEKAIEFQPVLSGEWYVSDTRCGPMVHARLGVAAENSGKLVSTVRREARRIAEAEKRDLIIVDGPPGIGCPVIASLTGATIVLVVTEPTVSGEHDLERVLKLARHFDMPAAVCVNKWDLNPEMTERIEDLARRSGATIAGRVRYDRAVTAAQMQELVVVETAAPCVADIQQVWKNINL